MINANERESTRYQVIRAQAVPRHFSAGLGRFHPHAAQMRPRGPGRGGFRGLRVGDGGDRVESLTPRPLPASGSIGVGQISKFSSLTMEM